MLISMENEWKTKMFEMTKFGDSRIPILMGSAVEEMQISLDEHVLISQTIVTNPDVSPIYQRASDWATLMQFTQDILEMFISVQVNYLYLWPIFNSCSIQEDVKELLDADAFIKVDATWKTIMNNV